MAEITGADVVAFRERRKMTRAQLGKTCGLTDAQIWRIEELNVWHEGEEQALLNSGVIAVTIPDTIPPMPVAPEFIEPIHEENVSERLQVIIDQAPEPIAVVIEERDADLAALSAEVAAKPTYERYISNSELQTFKRCRRKWFLSWHRGLKELTEAPIGVRQIGARLHRALATHYVPGGPPNARTMLDELERFIVLDRTAMNRTDASDEVKAKFEKEADLERIMLEGYLQWLTETGADAELKVIAPETYLEVGLEEFSNTVAIIGKLDVRVQRTTDGAILFLDHKSLAEFTKETMLLPIKEQMMHYQLLETLNAPEGQHVAGALYNMLRRVKRTGTAVPPFYQRVEVHHNAHTLQNYRKRIVSEIQDIKSVERYLEQGDDHRVIAYPSPTRDCYWDCPFLQVCPMFDDGSRAEDMLKEYFVQSDPLEYYMTEMIGEERNE